MQRARGVRDQADALHLALALCLLCQPVPAMSQAEKVQGMRLQVIVHPLVDRNALSREFLRAVFSRRVTFWPDGRPVKVFVLRDSALHESFCLDVLGTYPYVLQRIWDRMLYTGTGIPPAIIDSPEEMRNRVLQTPGAIGYLPANPSEQSQHPRIIVAWRPF